MSKILVVSDSHKNPKTIEEMVMIESPDCFIFCGDLLKDLETLNFSGNLYAVKGNWDFRSHEKGEKIVEIDGKRLFITHGNKYNIKKDLCLLKNRASELNCNIVCYGHTHMQKLDVVQSVTYVNPGLAKIGNYAIIEINKNAVNVELKNLYKK